MSLASQAATLAELVQLRADATPDQLTYLFLIDGEEEGPRLTYAELDRAARAIAATLRDTAGPGERALLLYEPGIDFMPAFFGCQYAGIIPVPVCPPRLDRILQSWQGLANVTADCQPSAVLTTSDLAASLAKGFASFPGGPALRWVATDQIDPSRAHGWREPHAGADALALLQYTSGSTATPKGVMVSHRNLMHNELIIETAIEHSGRGLGVCWLPLYHDLGLIGGALQGVFHGDAPVVLMSPLGMLQRPVRWLNAITRYRSDTSGGPNFAFDLCVQRVTEEQKAALDLSRWSIAAIGSEPVSAATMARFSAAFASCGFQPEAFYPTYGLAEATLFVAGGDKGGRPVVRTVSAEALGRGQVVTTAAEAPDARPLVGCGRPWLGQEVAIVHPDALQRCAEGTVGEVWVRGASVAQGYWNKREETEHTFRARLSGSGDGPFLRTGDLGFIADGELFITGRLKDVIVIRGRNYYPQDIEATVQAAHAGLRPESGAAFETGLDGHPRLVVVQEVERRTKDLDLTRLTGDVRQAVAEGHDLQLHDVVFLEAGSLPRTSSGKVQRHACRAGYERGMLRRWRGK